MGIFTSTTTARSTGLSQLIPDFGQVTNEITYHTITNNEYQGVPLLAKRLWLLVIWTVVTACGTVANPTPHADIATYHNEQYNFELDYPVGWVVEETSTLKMFMSFEPGSLPGSEGIPPEHSKMDMLPSLTVHTTPFRDFVAQEMKSLTCVEGDPIPFALDHSGQAVEITATTDMGGTHSIIYAEMEGRYFTFVTYGNRTPARSIVRSLRSITPPDQIPPPEPINVTGLAELAAACYEP
jgi:hypothetical protein